MPEEIFEEKMQAPFVNRCLQAVRGSYYYLKTGFAAPKSPSPF